MVALSLGEEPGAEQHDQADRDVDEEHPAPVEVVGQRAAQQQADRGAEARHGRVHAHGPVARLALGKVRGDQGQGGRRGDGGSDTLQDAGADQESLVRGEAAEQRGEGEHRDADAEHAAPAEQVASPAAQQEQAAEGQGIRVDHPGQVRRRDAEVGLDARQGDVRDRAVQDDHQLGRGDDEEGQPEVMSGRLPFRAGGPLVRGGGAVGGHVRTPGSEQGRGGFPWQGCACGAEAPPRKIYKR